MEGVSTRPELLEFLGKSPKRRIGSSYPISTLNAILKHFEDVCNTSMRDEAWWVPDICREPAGIWRGPESGHSGWGLVLLRSAVREVCAGVFGSRSSSFPRGSPGWFSSIHSFKW